jgi:hypothetical protein
MSDESIDRTLNQVFSLLRDLESKMVRNTVILEQVGKDVAEQKVLLLGDSDNKGLRESVHLVQQTCNSHSDIPKRITDLENTMRGYDTVSKWVGRVVLMVSVPVIVGCIWGIVDIIQRILAHVGSTK